MCALIESWLSRITPRFLAVGTEVTKALSMEIVRSCMGHDLAGKKRSYVRVQFEVVGCHPLLQAIQTSSVALWLECPVTGRLGVRKTVKNGTQCLPA